MGVNVGVASPHPAPAIGFETKKVSFRRRLVFSLLALLMVGGLCEVGARLLLFARNDWNPYYLTFGLVPDIEDHSRAKNGYSTFQPGVQKRQKIADRLITMQINGNGFRGTRDFSPKPPDVFRIASLGASSTFGYHVADDETYPVQLERALAARTHHPVEVFNLGMPHARLDNIVALARHELPKLEPDVVTLYAGYNNAVLPADPKTAAAAFRLKDWLYGHIVGWRYVHDLVKVVYLKALNAAPAGTVETPNLMVPLRLTVEQIEVLRNRASVELERQVRALVPVVESAGGRLVLVSQTYLLPAVTGVVGYRAELAEIEGRLVAERTLPAILATRLIHGSLNERLRALAATENLLWVDGIEALAGVEEEAMTSQVHLSPLGNRLMATALVEGLIEAGLVETVTGSASSAVLP